MATSQQAGRSTSVQALSLTDPGSEPVASEQPALVQADEPDHTDPAAIQLTDDTWGLAYVDGGSQLVYRRALGNQGLMFWRDPMAVDTGDSPAIVELGSTSALFCRKSDGAVRQVFVRTSADDGASWSTPTQVSTETVRVYQIQAWNDAGTVYLFWSSDRASAGTVLAAKRTQLGSVP